MATGMGDIDFIKKAFQVGSTNFITKPPNPIILTECIRYMLQAGGAFQDLRQAEEMALNAQQGTFLQEGENDLCKPDPSDESWVE